MDSLKHDMRRIFEERDPAHGSSYYDEIDEGLLKQIINLSVLNPSVFSRQDCSVTAVKTYEARRKLYRISNGEHRILDASAILIITRAARGIKDNEADLLTVSVMYSAMFFNIDTCTIILEDERSLKRAFGIPESQEIVTTICLGSFYDHGTIALQLPRHQYSLMVREL